MNHLNIEIESIMKTMNLKSILKNISKKADQLYNYLFDKMFGWVFISEIPRQNGQHSYRMNTSGLIVRIG